MTAVLKILVYFLESHLAFSTGLPRVLGYPRPSKQPVSLVAILTVRECPHDGLLS